MPAKLPTHSPRPQKQQPPPPHSNPRTAALSDAARTPYLKRRSVIYAVSVAAVVISGTLFGAVLKDERQRWDVQARGLGVQEEGKGEERARQLQLQQQQQAEQLKPKPNQKPRSEQEQAQERKRILLQIEELEARRKELVMNRGEIVGKVEMVRERARKREMEERERNRVGGGGEMVVGEGNMGGKP